MESGGGGEFFLGGWWGEEEVEELEGGVVMWKWGQFFFFLSFQGCFGLGCGFDWVGFCTLGVRGFTVRGCI